MILSFESIVSSLEATSFCVLFTFSSRNLMVSASSLYLAPRVLSSESLKASFYRRNCSQRFSKLFRIYSDYLDIAKLKLFSLLLF
jgi:hypothetical protein